MIEYAFELKEGKKVGFKVELNRPAPESIPGKYPD